MAEGWRDIVGYEGLYEVSSFGRVRSLAPPRSQDGILRGDVDKDGYRRVLLSKGGIKKRHKVHRLVCRAFHGEQPVETQCGHRNGDCSDNTADNLGWISRSENTLDSIKHGTYVPLVRPDGPRPTKLTAEQAKELRVLGKSGKSGRFLAKQFGISHGYAHKIISGRRRKIGEINECP